MLIAALILALILAVPTATVFAAELSVPISVVERQGTPRTAEIVTVGVPLPQAENISATAGLQIVDASGLPVPAQFRVLSRWGPVTDTTRPIRWVLVDFEASVGAKATGTYRLARAASRPDVSGIAIADSSQVIRLDTGAMVMRIQFMRFADQLFRDHMFYREVRPAMKDKFFSPSVRSKIWWSFWPATAPKELGLLSRAGQFYLHTVWSSAVR